MTIDNAISHLYKYSSTMGSGQTTQAQHEDAKRVAIETMRKYQQIEQIVKEWEFDHESMVDSMEKISEVVEDENTMD